MMMQHPFAFVPDKVPVVDVTLVKTDLVLRPVVLELPVGWRGDNQMHRPVSEEVHLSAVAVDYGVMALQGALGCLGFESNSVITHSSLPLMGNKHNI